MKKRLIVALLALFFVSTACQMLSGPIGVTAKPGSWVVQKQTNPINLNVTLDTVRKATSTISSTGGSLSVTGADGALYQLYIPAGALVVDTEISMTPVQNLSGMPFKGSGSLAVQLEPSGLRLYDFAILTITPAQDIPINQQIPFGYEGNGQNLFLAAPVVNSKEIKLKILHFSGYGVDKGLLADIEPVRQRLGGDEEARYGSLMSELLDIQRQNELAGIQDDSLSVDIAALTQLYYDRVLKVRLAAAGESCAASRLAIQTFLSWERQRQLMGYETEPDLPDLPNLLSNGWRVCLKEEYQLCHDQHIIHRMIPVILGMERQMVLLGIDDPQLTALAKNYAERCLRFDLVFQSQASLKSGGGGFESHVSATVPLRFSADNIPASMNGQAALNNDFFNMSVKNCTITNKTGGGQFNAIEMVYKDAIRGPDDQLGYVKDISLTFFPGITSESYTATCGQASVAIPPNPMWTGLFVVTHNSERKQAGSGSQPSESSLPDLLNPSGGAGFQLPSDLGNNAFVMTGWQVPAGELFATLDWSKSDAGMGVQETGSFKLYHRPG